MPITRRPLLAAAALLAAFPARAAEPAPYLTPADVDLTVLLPPPPPPGSPLALADIEAVIAAQSAATPERVAQAQADGRETVFDMFGAVLGPRATPDTLPRTTDMFARIGASEDVTVDPAKPFFARTRPYLADPRVKPLIRPSRSGSWPSGHSTRVTVMAIVLAHLLPDRRDAIWARAADYAQSRVIGGMHYPSDLGAGQRAGTAIAQALFTRPDFRADLAAARTELAALP